MRISTALAAAMLVACAGRAARAPIQPIDRCYRFDHAYFGWPREDSSGRMVADTSAIVELRAQAHPPYPLVPQRPSVRAVAVPLLRGSPVTARVWLEPSYWEPVGADSIIIVWRDGYVGPTFRVQVRGDSLVGRMRWTTDELGRTFTPVPVSAVRVVCPASAPTT